MIQDGFLFLALGLIALVVVRLDLIERGLKVPSLRWLLLPYKLPDLLGFRGGYRRYMLLMGLLFLILGAAIIVQDLVK